MGRTGSGSTKSKKEEENSFYDKSGMTRPDSI